jgi:branched-chain amino acid transport system substrate-binding protein
MVWHPKFPYKSYLTGQTCQEYAEQYTADTGEQWTQPLGQLGKYEWCIDILKRWDPEQKEQFGDVVKASKFECINGPVDYTLPVQMGTTRPVPNVFKIKIAGGQWGKSADPRFPYDLSICYGQDPNMPIERGFEPMGYIE